MNKELIIAGRRGGKTAALVHALAAEVSKQQEELATLRAENAHLKNMLALVEALRNKERGFAK